MQKPWFETKTMSKEVRKSISVKGGSIRFRFNMIAKLGFKETHSEEEIIDVLKHLPKAPSEENQIGHGYIIQSCMEHRSEKKLEKEILEKLIVLYHLRHYRRTPSNEVRAVGVYIFWLYPDFIVFAGSMKEIERVQESFRTIMSLNGITFQYFQLDFEKYYLLKLFENAQNLRHREEASGEIMDDNETDAQRPAEEIARGIYLDAIHDVSSEGEIGYSQAKRILAKDSPDSTADLVTCISLLSGYKLKSVLISVEMEEYTLLARLFVGGTMYIYKDIDESDETESGKTKTAKKKEHESEEARVAQGICFSKRLYDAHQDWTTKPIEEMLPKDDLFVKLHENVKLLIGPILKAKGAPRIAELQKLRKRMKKERKK